MGVELFVLLASVSYVTTTPLSVNNQHETQVPYSVQPVQEPECCFRKTRDICQQKENPCLEPCLFEEFTNISPYHDQAFVLETSHSNTLSFRQACSLESLALQNPYLTVQLLMTSESIDFESVPIKTLLSNYPNIRITPIDLDRLFIGTPLEHFHFCYDWKNSLYAIHERSDVVRLWILHIHGGYYFDLDIIHFRPVTSHRNFMVAEDDQWVANGVMHADPKHPVIRWALEKLTSITYRKSLDWGEVGPKLVTRVLNEWCNVDSTSQMTSEGCYGFQALPTHTFFPIPFENGKSYFHEWTDEEVQNFLSVNSIFGAHVWNRMTAETPVYKKSKQLYAQLARKFCPSIYQMAPDTF